MKFPRNARMLRGHLDAAPFAGVFFCLLLMILIASLVYTPGVVIELPAANGANFTAADGPTVAIALDDRGRFYFRNQSVTRQDLPRQLKEVVAASPVPMTLLVRADYRVSLQEFDDVVTLGKAAGFKQVIQVLRPPLFDSPDRPKEP